jgi:hypothetical protein
MDHPRVREISQRLPVTIRGFLWSAILGISASPVGAAMVIAFNVSRRLRGPHPNRPPPESLSAEELDAVSYSDIDMLKAIPNKPTHEGYAIVGGSGFVGKYVPWHSVELTM